MGSASRILFLGNSYSFVNNFRNTFAELAKAGGHKVVTDWAVARTFADHVASTATRNMLTSSEWDFVVLQEQTQIPSIEQFRTELMYPAARELVQKISVSGASPMFFQASAGRHGWPENGLNGYESMQLQINQGYLKIAQELNVPIAPVGQACLNARRIDPQLDLWQDDRHPNQQGSYLAACVFYAAIFHESPEGLNYFAYLSDETAQVLQMIAAETVLKN